MPIVTHDIIIHSHTRERGKCLGCSVEESCLFSRSPTPHRCSWKSPGVRAAHRRSVIHLALSYRFKSKALTSPVANFAAPPSQRGPRRGFLFFFIIADQNHASQRRRRDVRCTARVKRRRGGVVNARHQHRLPSTEEMHGP